MAGRPTPPGPHFYQTRGNLEDQQIGGDGKASKVPDGAQRDLAGEIKAVEEPGTSVIWELVFQRGGDMRNHQERKR